MQFLISTAIIASIAIGFLFFPQIASSFVTVMLCLIFGFLGLVFAFVFYASYRQKKGKPIKGVTVGPAIYTPGAFVGLQGQGVGLLTESRDGKLRIRLSAGSYLFVLAGCFFFGPGMIGAFILHRSSFHLVQAHGKEQVAVIGVAILVGISTLLFFYYLRIVLGHIPVIEVTPEAIRLMRGVTQEGIILSKDIKNFDVRTSQFDAGGDSYIRNIDNYTLCAVLNDGKVKGLCITDNRSQIETLKNGLEEILNVKPLPAIPLVSAERIGPVPR